jgi:hypothetical protein
MQGKNGFGLALNLRIIIIIIAAMIVAADAHHIFQGATNFSFPGDSFFLQSKN